MNKIASPNSASSFMFISGPHSSLPFSSRKESHLVPLGFMMNPTGTGPSRLDRMCLWSDKEDLEETSQLRSFQSPKDPMVF